VQLTEILPTLHSHNHWLRRSLKRCCRSYLQILYRMYLGRNLKSDGNRKN